MNNIVTAKLGSSQNSFNIKSVTVNTNTVNPNLYDTSIAHESDLDQNNFSFEDINLLEEEYTYEELMKEVIDRRIEDTKISNDIAEKIGKLDLTKKADIEKARKLYEGLNPNQKAYFDGDVLAKIEKAENQYIANETLDKINKLDLTKKENIDKARELYNSLTPEQKACLDVDVLGKIEKAEVELKNKEERQKKESELQKLYQARDDNNGFFHPIKEKEIESKIAALEKELGVPHKPDGWEKFCDKAETAGAYAATFAASAVEGFVDLGEGVIDAHIYTAGKICQAFGVDDKWAEDIIAYDVSGKMYDAFVDVSGIDKDIAYGKAHDAGNFVGEMVGYYALSSVPYVGPALCCLAGAGSSIEDSINRQMEETGTVNDWVVFGESALGALEGYGFGKAGKALNTGVKAFKKVGVSGAKQIAKESLKSVSKETIKTTLKGSGKIALNAAGQTLTDSDTYVELASVLGDDIVQGIETGEWNAGGMLAEGAVVLGENYVGNLGGNLVGDMLNGSKKISVETPDVKPKMDYATHSLVSGNTIEENLLEVISRHESKYGQGDITKRLEQFFDPLSPNYHNYNLISSSNDAREIFAMYTPDEIKHGLENLNYMQDGRNVSGYFSSLGSSKNGTYGADQGGIASLCKYTYNGKEYTYRQAMEIYNDALNNGRPVPHFQKNGSFEYLNLKNKLVSKGFSPKDASVIMSTVDDAGACSYAATVNEIFASFAGKEDDFYRKFGYPMYKTIDGKKVLNSNELLLDLYVEANRAGAAGGGFILDNNSLNPYLLKSDRHDVLGRQMLDAESQVYMSYLYSGKNERSVSYFLNSKGINYSSERLMFNHNPTTIDNPSFYTAINKAYSEMNSGKSISLDIFSSGNTINMNSTNPNLYPSVSTSNWGEGGGHSVFVTGFGSDCFYVSSWGQEYSIPFSDLKNGGIFNVYSADIS